MDLVFNKIKIQWTLYYIDSNINQWIGIYKNNNLIGY